ncbi:MAG: hypothetical protein CVV41_21555 [Candidatus Riflebacteria bacterium HGW-Riflebacteria-1]|jgi:type II secretory ATPase GspE/PulE/Tfp pilus assembly ATPase PilB-like protein|nr:MAG: hypothetical protein CVV41_21555 [Candidatus Riflebacteria bacterium HGW-Riflebacteria-1]
MTKAQFMAENADGFGLMPLSFKPGRLKKLLGHNEFVIDAECLQLCGNEPQSLAYADLKEVCAQRGRLRVESVDGRSFFLRSATDADTLAELIRQLVDQAREYTAFMANPSACTVEESMQLFARCLKFRALPYVWAVDVLLTTAALNHFSDIHLEPLDVARARLTFRASGQIRQSLDLDLSHQQRLLARLKFLAGCHSHIADIVQEGAFKQADFDVRLSTFPTDHGERAALRIISALCFPNVAALGWPDKLAQKWLENLQNNRGLFIICGPVGSGKTTAMYASLAELAGMAGGLRVVTIEDPVEARISGICQSSLDSTREKSLAVAFKHLLRQDPDVIALGEIRDCDCIKEALQAALSGHLILATFHAGSPAEALDRIRQMGIDDYLVFSGLRGILHLELKYADGCLQPQASFAGCSGGRLVDSQ